MDFSFSEEQEAVRELADRIFTDLSTQERLREIEAEARGDRFDRKLWSELAAAGLLGHRPARGRRRRRTRLPGDRAAGRGGRSHRGLRAGGRDAGRRRAGHRRVRHRRPATAVAARSRSGRHGPHHCTGRARRHPLRPATVAEPAGDGWTLTGVKACVPSGTVADAVLVSARIEPDAVAVFLVETGAAGLTSSARRQQRPAGGTADLVRRRGRAGRPPRPCGRRARPSSNGWSSAAPRPWPWPRPVPRRRPWR